jgi:pSer/pThr/pTyr-binding forkhead associated (FHA) protein
VGDPQGLNPFGETLSPDSRPPPGHSPTTPAAAGGARAAVTSRLPERAPAVDPEQVSVGAPRALAGFLVNYSNGLGLFWPLYQGRNLVGRRQVNSRVDVAIDDSTTSSEHALILASACPARMKIEDCGSTNGTFVADLRLERGQRREVHDGEVLRFGAFVTIVKII